MLSPTTELQAVNIMLSTIGESPINSLDGSSAVADSTIAREVLKEVSIQVQEEGWHFNIEKNFLLTPTNTGEIFLPSNCIQCDSSGYDYQRDVCVRGTRLYDREKHTYQFDAPIHVDMFLLLEFEELPQAARHYITIRSARVFQQRVVGSETLGNFTERDEMRARANLRKYEADTADYNILTGNYDIMKIIER